MLSLALQFLAGIVDKNGTCFCSVKTRINNFLANNSSVTIKDGGVASVMGYLQTMNTHQELVEPSILVLSRISEKEKSIFQDSRAAMDIIVATARQYPFFVLLTANVIFIGKDISQTLT